MKISPLSFTSSRKTTYKTSNGQTYTRPYYSMQEANNEFDNKVKGIVNANCTYFFRSDIPWYHLAGYLKSQYPTGNVNIYSLACSDGSEAYSIIIDLISKLGKKEAQRFLPIKAHDADREIIEEAKNGEIYASIQDIERIRKTIKDNEEIERFFDIEKLTQPIKGSVDDEKLEYILHPNEIWRKNVIFECKDIEDSIDEIQGGNNFISARNFWKYLSGEKCGNATYKLRQNMSLTDRLMLGNFDYDISFPYFTKQLGLVPDGTYFHNDYINIFKIDENKMPWHMFDKTLWIEYAKDEHKIYSPFGWSRKWKFQP